MNKEFVTYNQALALKELGFNESCIAIYSNANPKTGLYNSKKYKLKLIKQSSQIDKGVKSPLYQQAFRWFRDKHDLSGEVYTINMGAIDYTFGIRDLYSEDLIHDNFEACAAGYVGTFLNYEEAYSACLDKLIEISKNK